MKTEKKSLTTTSKRTIAKTSTNHFSCLKKVYDDENIDLNNVLINKADCKSPEKSNSIKIKQNEKVTHKISMTKENPKPKALISKEDYKLIFKTICENFLAIYNPEKILFREAEMSEIILLKVCINQHKKFINLS